MKAKKVSKNKKRFLSLSMAMLAALSFGSIMAACGDDGDSSSSSSTPPPVEATTYTVSFNVDGTAISTATVNEGEKATKPADPTKAGQVFVGWYKDSTFKNLYNFNEAVKGNVSLHARFATPSATEFTATFIVDGEAFTTEVPVSTVGGVFYEYLLPTPTKAGATFAGWWTSDYEDATKVTARCSELAVEQNVKLYAVWANNAPLVSVNADGISWLSDKTGQVSLKISCDGTAVHTKTVNSTSYVYDFDALPGGNYEIEVTIGGATGKAYFKNKALAKVSVFSYEGTVLSWNAVENATEYLVSIECGDANHTHVDEVVTTTSYNFANCAMKADGIKFTVKAKAEGYMTSVSDVYSVIKNLNATANIAYDATAAKITWDSVENATGYKVVINGQEFNTTANEYSVEDYDKGNLAVSVTPVAFGFNSPAATTATVEKTNLPTPKNINLNGTVLTWDTVASATGYVVTVDGEEYTVTENAFDFANADNIDQTASSCQVTVKAVGETAAVASKPSAVMTIGFGVMADTLAYENGKVIWDPAIYITKYEVRVGEEGTIVEVAATERSKAVTFTEAGTTNIYVRCYNQNNVPSNWVSIAVDVYEITFNYGVAGTTKPAEYKVAGDTFEIPADDPATPGYDFVGWFNAATNGREYTSKQVTFDPANGCEVHAVWKARTYKLTYIIMVNGEEQSRGEIDVTYDQAYNLPVPEGDASFGGWWTEVNGQGNQLVNNMGNSVGVWKFTEDQTVYANAAFEIFDYEEIVSVATGEAGWSVKAGADIGSVTEIKIPAMYNGLPVIGIEQMGFANCGHLTKLSIPDTMETIFLGMDGPYYGTGSALYHCAGLEAVEVYEVAGNHQKFYKSIDGALVRMTDYNGVELVYVPYAWDIDEYRIPDEVTTITTNLFRYYKTIKKIVIPNTVTRIDSGAFNSCKMQELVFEEGGDAPLVIGAGAFKSCEFTSLTLPARMGAFEDEAGLGNVFTYCSYLKEIIVEEGNEVYSSKSGFLYNKDGDKLLYAPRGMSGAVVIPNGTVEIMANSFAANINSTYECCQLITKITIPVGVTKIGSSAFRACTSLVEVEFLGGENDEKIDIGAYAFYSTILSELTLPANTGKISTYAFGNIKTLGSVRIEAGEGFEVETGAFGDEKGVYYVTNVYLGKNVRVFDVNGAFGPTKLSSIEKHPDNNYLELVDGVLFDKGITQIVYYPASKTGNYTIPSTIEVIGGNVFNGKSLEEVEIPFTVKEIGGAAFANCARLTTVTFLTSDDAQAVHPGLTIGAQAFMNCEKLEGFTLPSYTTEIGAQAFESCISMTGAFEVPDDVTTIGDAAFRYMTGITSISLPAGLETIEPGRDNMTSSSLTTYPWYYRTFIGCDALTEITVADGNENYKTVGGILYGLTGGVVTDLITCPSGYAVNEGKAVIPGTVRKIWAYAFYKNVALKELSFAELVLADGETASSVNIEIGKSAFEEAQGLQRATLGKGVNTISNYLFKNCKALEYVFIPNTVSTIEYGQPFTGCASLATIDFEAGNESNALVIKGSTGPNNAYTGASAFYKLNSLTEIRFPKRTKEIGNMALVDCANLRYVFVPNTVTYFGNWMFGYGSNTAYRTGCTSLETVEFEAGNDELPLEIGQRAFEGSVITSVTLPKRTAKLGTKAFAGSKITSISIPENVTDIGANAFQYCVNLAEITLEGTSKIKSIGDYAFASCPITEFEIPATVETIGKYAFAYTEQLDDLTFAEGSNLKEIKDYAFRQSGISSLEFPESANAIKLGVDLFQYCTNLESVHVSSSVTAIGDTFGHCGSLQTVTIDPNNANFKVDNGALYNANGTAIQYLFKSAEVDSNGVYTIANNVVEIGTAAFRGQINIKKLIIPASVTKIGASAFRYCVNLEEIVFDLENSQLTEIADSAFEGCSKLKSVNLPVSVKKLGKYAFSGCTSLATASISGVTELSGFTFMSCTALKQIDLSSVTKTGQQDFSYAGLTSVTIPAGMTMGTYMFYKCPDLTEVTLSNGLTSIGNYSFRGCTALTEIALPATVTKLGNYAFAETGLESFAFTNPAVANGTYLFYGCENLQSVTMIEGMTTLTTGMFYNCTSLGAGLDANTSAVELPSSINAVHGTVFYGCTSMKMIEFPAGVVDFGTSSRWSTSTTSSLFMNCTSLEKVILPATLEKIGGQAFYNCTSLKTLENVGNITFVGASAFRNTGLVSITLPSVTSVKNYAFAGNVLLTDVHLNDNLAGIEYCAFMGCTSLKEIQLPSMLTLLGSTSSTGTASVFKDCTSLERITLPVGISEVRKNLFENCTSLEEVNFEGQIVAINAYAFANCSALTQFTWTDFLLQIDDYAFANSGITKVQLAAATNAVSTMAFVGCPIAEFNVPADNVYYKVVNNVLVNYDTDEWMLALPSYAPAGGKLVIDATTPITFTEYATPFADNTTITEIEIKADANWTEIPANLFYGMKNLTTVTLPAGIETIGDYAFEACPKLTTVNLPSTLKTLGEYAFYGCEAMTQITLPTSLEEIGEYAFYGTNLASIEIPASVKKINGYTFHGLESLTSVTLNEGLELIGAYAFSGTGITSVTIPASVQTFGTSVTLTDSSGYTSAISSSKARSFAFADCTELTTVTFLGTDLTMTGFTFMNCTALTTVNLPAGLTAVEDYMFYGCTALTNVTLPSTVTSIGAYSFADSGITSITLPANLKYIGQPTLMTDPYQTGSTNGQTEGRYYQYAYPNGHVFMGCTSLTEVIIQGNVEQIGWYAFEGCTALESITLPNSVRIIGDYAFANCTSLTSLNVPTSTMFIGDYAFANSAIESVVIPSTAVVYDGAFSGWTATQTVNIELSAYKAWSIWNLAWNKGNGAAVVWEYVPTV